MTISTYAELLTAITNYTHRADLSTPAADFVTLAEAKFNRRLRLRAQESRATASISTEYTDLPSSSDTGLTDFLEMRNIQLNLATAKPLIYMAPEVIDLTWGGQSGEPVNYAIVGNELQLAPVPDTTYTVEMAFYAKFAALSSAVNWLFQNHPDLYLAACMIEASLYAKDDKSLQRWYAIYNPIMESLMLADDRSKWSGSALTMRAV